MSEFWSLWIIVLTVLNVLGCWWLIRWTMKKRDGESAQGDVTGHVWDGDLEEYNNPLPRWWLWLFYITLVFAVIYFALYPGLGKFQGVLGWSSAGEWQGEMDQAKAKYDPIFQKYASVSVEDLATKPEYQEARDMGKRLYLTYCMQCHGSDARGAKGFPNLADKDWSWGGTPDAIKHSIANGRMGMMPPFPVGEENVAKITQYLLSGSGRATDEAAAAEGKTLFLQNGCIGCHGMNGEGMAALGAPNLMDDAWIYGGSPKAIAKTITEGQKGEMPAHQDLLGSDKVHLLTSYVYSLSNN